MNVEIWLASDRLERIHDLQDTAVDDFRNRAGESVISPTGARIVVCMVPTDEELEITTQTQAQLE